MSLRCISLALVLLAATGCKKSQDQGGSGLQQSVGSAVDTAGEGVKKGAAAAERGVEKAAAGVSTGLEAGAEAVDRTVGGQKQ